MAENGISRSGCQPGDRKMCGPYEKQPVLVSIGPHLGLFFGAIVGWVLLVAAGQPPSDVTAVLGRLISVICSLVFWSVFSAALQGKEIYGGGTLSMIESERPRARLVVSILVLLWIVAIIFFASRDFLWSAIFILFIAVVFTCELCFRDPLWILRIGPNK